MKTTKQLCSGTLLGVLMFSGVAQAWWRSPALLTPLPIAPDACGPGFYTVCPNGTAFGPNYCVYPPCAPFNGLMPPDKARMLEHLQGQGIYHQGNPAAFTAPFSPGFAPGLGAPGSPPPPGVTQGLPTPGYTPYTPYLPNPGVNVPPPGQQPSALPSHPFARSPRDFFMWSDVMQDRQARAARPALVP